MAANQILITTIHQKEEIVEDIVPARQVWVSVERRSDVPLLGKGSSIQPRIPLIEHIEIVINSDPSTADHGTFLPTVSYMLTLDGTETSEVPSGGDARGYAHCFHVLQCYDRCLPGVHVRDECKDLGFETDSLANGLGRVRKVLGPLIWAGELMSSRRRRLSI
ncbi:hypothetical protein SADUNF_Sadunf09G0103100 [Salix dunnii]|uniref:Uncharacterized protein n=1 Tax=Salix dunnii TaxID=1413687 RepID=A0A835MTJ5_9ROSI|nr:hypothetical protein SADUNF_Sadunf09G0103100 [Salix dunnii]